MLVRNTIALIALIASVYAECPRDWFAADGSCWAISHEKTKWTGAESACRAFHGDLAVITDNQVKTTIEIALHSQKGDKFWIGGTDMLRESDWLWAPTETKIDFQPFGFRSPSNNDKDKNCLYIDKGHSTWSAEQCDEEFYFICQHKPVQATSAPAVG